MMPRILACTACPDDWQQFLANPVKNWRDGYSAKAVARSWEAADGFPPEVSQALNASDHEELFHAVPFLAVPEYRTDLPGGDRSSQTDVMVLGCAKGGAFAMAVEGKVAESFGPTIGEWRQDASDSKKLRWSFLCATLGLDEDLNPDLRYQLFHRTASAVLAARRHHARLAIMLVQSFSHQDIGHPDFAAFLALFGAKAAPGTVVPLTTLGVTSLYAGWVRGHERFLRPPS